MGAERTARNHTYASVRVYVFVYVYMDTYMYISSEECPEFQQLEDLPRSPPDPKDCDLAPGADAEPRDPAGLHSLQLYSVPPLHWDPYSGQGPIPQ